MTKYIIETKKPITACMSFEDDQEACPFCAMTNDDDDNYGCQHPPFPPALNHNAKIIALSQSYTKPDWCPLEEVEKLKENN